MAVLPPPIRQRAPLKEHRHPWLHPLQDQRHRLAPRSCHCGSCESEKESFLRRLGPPKSSLSARPPARFRCDRGRLRHTARGATPSPAVGAPSPAAPRNIDAGQPSHSSDSMLSISMGTKNGEQDARDRGGDARRPPICHPPASGCARPLLLLRMRSFASLRSKYEVVYILVFSANTFDFRCLAKWSSG